MLGRIPAAIRAAGVLVLTGWVGAYLVLSSDTPPHGSDINWAFLLGIGLFAIGVALASRPLQTRVPFLRPATYELAGVVRRWGEMLRRVEDTVGSGEQLPESTFVELTQLEAETDKVIAKHFLDWEPFYRHNLDPLQHSDATDVTRRKIEFRHYRLCWHLNDLHGGRDRGAV